MARTAFCLRRAERRCVMEKPDPPTLRTSESHQSGQRMVLLRYGQVCEPSHECGQFLSNPVDFQLIARRPGASVYERCILSSEPRLGDRREGTILRQPCEGRYQRAACASLLLRLGRE